VRIAHPVVAALVSIFYAIAIAACSTDALPAPTARASIRPRVDQPSPTDATPRDYPGIHNAVAYHDNFISGSAPDGDEGFETLAAMGVRTIISVDGAVPEVDRAAAHAIRYIHLPIGYNGFDADRKLALARATRDAMAQGPVYIHCHHGKHRSASAAATIAVCLGWATPDQAVARMKVSGTAPNYTGLYACAAGAAELSDRQLDEAPALFPSVSRPNSFVQGMLEMDDTFDRLKAIETAGWTTPADHPDLVPASEAGQLADHFRLLSESEHAKSKPAPFAQTLSAEARNAAALEDLLAAGETDPARLSAQFKVIGASCKDCHAKYRD
jgi:cytochrome c556